MGRVHQYAGREVEVHYEPARCIHAAECVRSLPSVFDPKATPWVDPDGADAEAVAGAVRRCPTGALSYVLKGGAAEAPDLVNSVETALDGPLYLRGRLVLVDAEGTAHPTPRLALCRCGASRHKPWCDNAHRGAGWREAGPWAAPEPCGQEPEGELRITPLPDGPLRVEGCALLRSAGSAMGTESYLCRCGASKNKPFCDGSHREVSFTSS